MRQLLLLSNSRDAEGRYLVHAGAALAEHFEPVGSTLFIPYALVIGTYDDYLAKVREALVPLGLEIRSIHESADPVTAVENAESIMIGGGNTFRLLATLQQQRLLPAIRQRVAAGAPYVGWSAGSVVACPTLRTTNDMPIDQPASFEALGLVDFQINAHFTDQHPPGFQGETRRERLAEFLAANPEQRVIGLPEGDWLRVSGRAIRLEGEHPAPLFEAGGAVTMIAPGSRAEEWLEPGG